MGAKKEVTNLTVINEYVNNKKSMLVIAKEYKLSYKFVRNTLIRTKTKIRTRKEAYRSRKGNFQYKVLNNKEFLEALYINELKDCNQIASIVGCSNWSILNALDFHGIKRRSVKEAIITRYHKNPHRSKYELLNDPEWLYNRAIVDKLQYQKIADLANVKRIESVRQALKKFKIFEKRRTTERVLGGTCYKILNNKKWLIDMYISKKLSTIEIGKIVGCNCSIVFQSLKRFNIPVRDRSDGHTVKDPNRTKLNLTDDILCIINGGLLGDSSLTINNGYGNPSYTKTSMHKEYIEYEAKLLFKDDWKKHIFSYNSKNSSFKNAKETRYCIQSLRYKSLKPLYNSWYVNRIKVIPDNIQLNKSSLLTWFMDDGYCYTIQRKNSHRPQIRVYLCTQCFQRSELENLCVKLLKNFGLHFYVRFHKRKKGVSQGTGLELELSLKDSIRFFETIGPCPVDCFKYKWKIDILINWLKNNQKRYKVK